MQICFVIITIFSKRFRELKSGDDVVKTVIFQFEVTESDYDKNLEKVQSLFRNNTLEEDSIVVLPEMWTSGYDLENIDKLAFHNLEGVKDEMAKLAVKYKVNIVAGSVPNIKEGEDVLNTAFVMDKKGQLVYEYSKIHLVPMLNEPKFLKGGDASAATFDLLGDKAGLVICYDLRFPELFRDLALEAAKVIFVVAEWPAERTEHWLTLLKARAIENQCYIVGSNTFGAQPNGTTFAGNSIIINPFGEVLAQGSADKEEVVETDINLDYIAQVREDIPIFNSRRRDMYKFL